MVGDARSILVVKLSSIGDVVQALPVAAAVRRRFPEAYIAWAVGPAAAEVVRGNPHLNETLVVGGSGEEREGARHVPGIGAPRRLSRALRERGFDLSLDMQGLFKSALIGYLSGARERIGFRNLQEGAFLFNNRRVVRDRRDVHAVEGYWGFAEAVGAGAMGSEGLDFTIATSDSDRSAAERLVGGRGRLVALIPGARWDSKRWPAERFAAAAEAMQREFGLTGVVVGGKGDGELAGSIRAAARSEVIDLTGKTTLKELAEVFRRCVVTIGNDTGPLYVSFAVGTPTVAVFGPTDPARLGPYGEGHAKVTAGAECAPCRRRRCVPLACMEEIEAEAVVEAAGELVRGLGDGGEGGG